MNGISLMKLFSFDFYRHVISNFLDNLGAASSSSLIFANFSREEFLKNKRLGFFFLLRVKK